MEQRIDIHHTQNTLFMQRNQREAKEGGGTKRKIYKKMC